MASAPRRSPGCVVTSLTRSPPSQTSRSWSRSPCRYSRPVRAGMATRVPRGGASGLAGSRDGEAAGKNVRRDAAGRRIWPDMDSREGPPAGGLYFEDFHQGDRFESASLTISEALILEFGR